MRKFLAQLLQRLALLIAVLILAVFLFFPPVTVLNKTHLIGYAICHQLPSRTFHIDHTPLPLCARCTGIYLGALLGVGGMIFLGRRRAIGFPSKPLLFVLISFIGLMGIDGVNSYLSFFPGAPRLYEPQNWLRLMTGILDGLAMIALTLPIFNQTVWHPDFISYKPVISNFKELSLFLVGAIIIWLIVLWQHPLLLYPLALLSTLGVLMMLGLINTVLVLTLTRREGQAYRWYEIVSPVLVGVAISLLMIVGMAGLRYMLPPVTGIR